ncbi:hypothetical protein EBS02_07700, partial [bacterium]|nr:hypothetical protein [bacterium]
MFWPHEETQVLVNEQKLLTSLLLVYLDVCFHDQKNVDLVNPGSKTFSLFDDLDSTDTLPWQWWGLIKRPVYNVYECPFGINCFLPGYIAKTTIKFTTPVRRDILGSSPYDIYASVSTGKDIHLPGKYLVNGKDPYLDSTGF